MTDIDLAEHLGTEARGWIELLFIWRDKADAAHVFSILALEYERHAYPLVRAAAHYALRA